jgi:hypothetical protein
MVLSRAVSLLGGGATELRRGTYAAAARRPRARRYDTRRPMQDCTRVIGFTLVPDGPWNNIRHQRLHGVVPRQESVSRNCSVRHRELLKMVLFICLCFRARLYFQKKYGTTPRAYPVFLRASCITQL